MSFSLFETVYSSEFSFVTWFARLLGVPERETEDVAQVVFQALHVAIKRGHFVDATAARPWLRKVTYRTVRDMKRKLNRHIPWVIEEDEFEPLDDSMDADMDRGLEYRRRWALVFSLLDELTYDRRVVFVMFEIERLTLPQIAAALGISINTVSSRLRAAREDFKAALHRRRVADARKFRGAGALLLPLDADSIMRIAQALPRPEAPSDAQARVWARLQQAIHAPDPMPTLDRRWRPRKLTLGGPEHLISGGAGFVAGVVASAIVWHALRAEPLPRPTREPAPIVAVASANADDVPAAFPILTPATTTHATVPATAMPATSSAPLADTDAEADGERRCLQVVRVALDATPSNPRKALDVLARCAQRYPAARLREERARLQKEAEAALMASRQR